MSTEHWVKAAGGYVLEVPAGDHLCHWLSAGRPYEGLVVRLIASLVRGGLFVDVGAHVGNHSIYAAKRGARVVAVEPHPATCHLLRRNVARNAVDVQIIQAALGAEFGAASIEVPISSNIGTAVVSFGEGLLCVMTLDSLKLAPTLIKVDVEGAEECVLAGAVETLREHRPALVCEGTGALFADLLEDLGYRRVGHSLAGSPTYLWVTNSHQLLRSSPFLLIASLRPLGRFVRRLWAR